MPLPLFFHLAVILRRKLELVKLLPCARFSPSSHVVSQAGSISPSHCYFFSSHSASEAHAGCFHPGEWIENASDLYTPSVQWAISSQAAEATSSGVTGQVIPQ